MSRAVGFLAGALLLTSVWAPTVAAQPSSGLGRRLTEPSPEALERSGQEPAEEAAAAEGSGGSDESAAPWVGPQLELAYGYLKLADGYGGGDAHFAHFELFIQLPVSEVRLGLGAALGNRDYSLGGDDLLARGSVEVGFQLTELIDPVVPYLSIVGSAGALVGERFESTVAYAVGGAGVELGAAVRIYGNFHLAVAFSYQRWEMDGAAFDVLMLRLGLGL